MDELKENEENKFVDCLHVGEELYRKYALENDENLK